MTDQNKKLLIAGVKIAGCLALNAVVPGCAGLALLMLGGKGNAGAEPDNDPYGIGGMATNVLSSIITGVWSTHKDQVDAGANHHRRGPSSMPLLKA